jgi:ubiquinone biosynthesis protein COQ4
MFEQILTGPSSEAEAMHVALNGSAWARAQLAVSAGLKLVRNTQDTQQVFYLAFAVDRLTLPRIYARLIQDPVGRELVRTQAAIDSKHVDFAQLRALPASTLGGAYARALEANGLDPDIFQRPPGLPDDFAYVAQRARQSHDLWHVLSGFGTDVPGEIALQAFAHAQLGQNFSKLIVRFGLLVFGARYPRVWRMVKRAGAAGHDAKFLLAVRWEDWWADSLEDVRARVGIDRAGIWTDHAPERASLARSN